MCGSDGVELFIMGEYMLFPYYMMIMLLIYIFLSGDKMILWMKVFSLIAFAFMVIIICACVAGGHKKTDVK